jgi:hypothetical protein
MKRGYQIILANRQQLKEKTKHLTITKFAVRIGKPRAVLGQSLPIAKRANPSKVKFLDAMTCLETSVPEFSSPLDQCGQAWCHLRLAPLLINERGTTVCSPIEAQHACQPRSTLIGNPTRNS